MSASAVHGGLAIPNQTPGAPAPPGESILLAKNGDSPNPVISICIANYNGESMLVDCIESILSQKGHTELEIIVHDDASSDQSVELIRRRYPHVRLIISTTNVGYCISNNRMATAARGDYLLLLNNDAALLPDALEALVHTLGGPRERSIATLPQYDWQTGQLVDRGCMLDPFYNSVPNLRKDRLSVGMAVGACLMIPRTFWEELGGFPEWFESIAEDTYISCAARLRGGKIKVSTSSGYRHRQGASFGGSRVTEVGLSTTYARRYLSERNRTSVLYICSPGLTVWPLLVVHVIAMLAEATIICLIRLSTRPWNEIYFPALASCKKHFATLQNNRTKLQADRNSTVSRYYSRFSPLPWKIRTLFRHGIPDIR